MPLGAGFAELTPQRSLLPLDHHAVVMALRRPELRALDLSCPGGELSCPGGGFGDLISSHLAAGFSWGLHREHHVTNGIFVPLSSSAHKGLVEAMTHKLSQSLLNIYTFSNKSTYAEVRDASPEYAQAALQHYLAQRLRTTALPQPHPLPLHSTNSFLQVLPQTFPLGEGASSHHTSHLATAACQMSPGPAAAVTIGWPRPRTRTPTSVRQMPPGQSIPSATPTNSVRK